VKQILYIPTATLCEFKTSRGLTLDIEKYRIQCKPDWSLDIFLDRLVFSINTYGNGGWSDFIARNNFTSFPVLEEEFTFIESDR